VELDRATADAPQDPRQHDVPRQSCGQNAQPTADPLPRDGIDQEPVGQCYERQQQHREGQGQRPVDTERSDREEGREDRPTEQEQADGRFRIMEAGLDVEPGDGDCCQRYPEGRVGGEHGRAKGIAGTVLPHAGQQLGEAAVEDGQADDDGVDLGGVRDDDFRVEGAEYERGEGEPGQSQGTRIAERHRTSSHRGFGLDLFCHGLRSDLWLNDHENNFATGVLNTLHT
jgi:hypothetical protein